MRGIIACRPDNYCVLNSENKSISVVTFIKGSSSLAQNVHEVCIDTDNSI